MARWGGIPAASPWRKGSPLLTPRWSAWSGHAGSVPSPTGPGRTRSQGTLPQARGAIPQRPALRGAQHPDRHQLKPADEAPEVASCHPSGRHGIRGRAACSHCCGNCGRRGGAENGCHERGWGGTGHGEDGSCTAQPSSSSSSSSQLLGFHPPSLTFSQQGSAPRTPEPPPPTAPLLSSHRAHPARAGPCQPAAPRNTPAPQQSQQDAQSRRRLGTPDAPGHVSSVTHPRP